MIRDIQKYITKLTLSNILVPKLFKTTALESLTNDFDKFCLVKKTKSPYM